MLYSGKASHDKYCDLVEFVNYLNIKSLPEMIDDDARHTHENHDFNN